MTKDDILIPSEIIEQSNAAIKSLRKDNESLDIVYSTLNFFFQNDTVSSKGFDGLKQQMSDYLQLIEKMKMANSLDIFDYNSLIMSVGSENLYGDEIVSNIETYTVNYNIHISQYNSYLTQYNNETDLIMKGILKYKYKKSYDLAQSDEELLEYWERKAAEFDNIQEDTNLLFENSAPIRDAIKACISDLGTTYLALDGYNPHMNAEWRTLFNQIDTSKADEITSTELLKKYGYSDSEIDYLNNENVYLTSRDINKLELTEDSEKIYISSGRNALFHKGKVYVIGVPDYTERDYGVYEKWKLIESVDKTDVYTTGNLGAVVKATEDIDPVEQKEVRTYSNQIVQQPGASTVTAKTNAVAYASVVAVSFFENNFDSTTVSLEFMEDEKHPTHRQVRIATKNYQVRKNYENLTYSRNDGLARIDRIRNAEIANQYIESNGAKELYKYVKGQEVPEPDKEYTVFGVVSEEHEKNDVDGYLSFSKEGDLLYNPVVYKGDEWYIGKIDGGFWDDPEPVYNLEKEIRRPGKCNQATRDIVQYMIEN